MPELELVLDVDRCHENGRRVGGMGGGIRPVFRWSDGPTVVILGDCNGK